MALSVTAAVFCCYIYSIKCVAGIVTGCAIILLLACASTVFVIGCKRGKFRLRLPIAFCMSLALSACAFGFGVSVVDEWNESARYDGYFYVTGRVTAVDLRSGEYRLNLENITLDGRPTGGMLRLSFETGEHSAADFVRCGDVLGFGANVQAVRLTENGKVNGTAFRTDIRYNAKTSIEIVAMKPGKATPMESFMNNWRDFYVENMGDKYGNIAFSILTGDKLALDYEITSYFSAAGLGHILAVSGLHVGFMALILGFMLKKLSKKVRYPIILAALIAYCAIADFSPSVTRALIMAVISGIGIMIGGRRDLLSSLLCAYSLILAVKPFYMFEAGFLFSFASIFGIALFSDSFKRKLIKHGVHDRVGNALGASASVTLSVFPAGSYLVGYINPISLITNAVLLPYVSVVFISIVCLTPIALIPGCGVLLVAPKYMLVALDYIAMGIASIPYSVIPLKTRGAVFLCYPVMFFASEFVMYPKKCTVAARVYSAATCIAIMGLCAL